MKFPTKFMMQFLMKFPNYCPLRFLVFFLLIFVFTVVSLVIFRLFSQLIFSKFKEPIMVNLNTIISSQPDAPQISGRCKRKVVLTEGVQEPWSKVRRTSRKSSPKTGEFTPVDVLRSLCDIPDIQLPHTFRKIEGPKSQKELHRY